MEKFGPHVEQLRAIAGSSNGRLLAIAGERAANVRETAVHVLQLPDAKARFSGPVDGPVWALAFMTDELLVAGSDTGRLFAWDAGSESPGQLFKVGAHQGAVRALATDTTGKMLASAGDDGFLRIFQLDVEFGKPSLRQIGERKLSTRALRAVAIDPDDRLVAVAGDDSVIRSIPLEQFKDADVREMPVGEGGVRALAFSHDGRVVAGCADGSIRICYLEGAADEENRSGEAPHEGPVTGLVFGEQLYDDADRPLPRRFFSVSTDKTLKSWLLDSKRKAKTFELSRYEVRAIARLPKSLVFVNDWREIRFTELDDKGAPSESATVIRSELQRLAEDLDARSDQVRIAAVRALGSLPEDDARSMLDVALREDDNKAVRKVAAEVIGLSARRLSRVALRYALDDDEKEVRDAAFSALEKIEKDSPLAPVRAALKSEYSDMRIDAVKRLPGLRDTSPLVPGLIAQLLSDNDQDVRLAALAGMFELEGEESLKPIQTALQRGPADIRCAALLVLGYRRQTRTEEGRALIESALDDTDQAVRNYGLLISVGARPRLAARLREVSEPTAKLLDELQTEGTFSDPETGDVTDTDLEPIFAALACRAPDMALWAASALASMGDGRSTGALLQLSRESDPKVREDVVRALLAGAEAMPGDARLTNRIEWLLDDEHGQVRSVAMDSLKSLADSDGRPRYSSLDHARCVAPTRTSGFARCRSSFSSGERASTRGTKLLQGAPTLCWAKRSTTNQRKCAAKPSARCGPGTPNHPRSPSGVAQPPVTRTSARKSLKSCCARRGTGPTS